MILIVLLLLMLFLLLGLYFLILATQYEQQARHASRQRQISDAPDRLLDRALFDLLRDTENRQSSLRHHSLLGDLYGNDGFTGRVIDLDRHAVRQQGPFLTISFEVVNSRGAARGADYYNGAVITLLSGRLKGSSVRVIRSPRIFDGESDYVGELVIERFDEGMQPDSGDLFLVNGLPFNGTGAGFNSSTGKLDLEVDDDGRVSLLPHFRSYKEMVTVDQGGIDEDYDAVDMQNMFLAKLPTGRGIEQEGVIPSFHRPHLIAYWLARSKAQSPDALKTLLPKFVMRPTGLEHPGFTGSNPAFEYSPDNLDAFTRALVTGPWDVDNDSDGIPDSIWLDLAEPVSAAPDGRLYRPLFAILCTDLDGRLNVNAHGNLSHLAAAFLARIQPEGSVASDHPIQVPRGLGIGPPEVNLELLFGKAEYSNLLMGRYTDHLRREPRFVPGTGMTDDLLSRLNSPMLPSDFAYNQQIGLAAREPALLHALSSPFDLHGRSAVVLDLAGQPIFLGTGIPGEAIDEPYELNLHQDNAADSPYTVSELERVLRVHDMDSRVLSDRLLRVAPQALLDNVSASGNRHLITTHSFHVPVPALQRPSSEGRRRFGPAATVTEWLGNRLRANGVRNVTHQVRLMLPFELLHGQKMDLNRMWSDHRDGTHDEFGRPGVARQAIESAMQILGARTGDLSDFRNGDLATAGRYARTRQIFARHLYCLAMLLLPSDYVDPVVQLENIPHDSQQAAELTARRIAQWAINVVDFRDPDAIMTPLEYDWNPLNGWQQDIDGDLNTVERGERRVVWGCEYPHLLLTETLGFHDTRLTDSQWDSGERSRRDQNHDGTSNPDEPHREDDDLDQFRIPQGSFFAELYCTFDANNRHSAGTSRIPPPELFQLDQADGKWKLDLGRVPPEARRDGGIYPVWRLAITRPHHSGESVLAELHAKPETTTLQPEDMNLFASKKHAIDRVVWFTRQPPTSATFELDRVFWNYLRMPTLLAGKRYAVIGPRTRTFVGSKRPNGSAEAGPSDQLIAMNLPSAGSGVSVSGGPHPEIPALGLVAAMSPPSSWQRTAATAPEGIGVNISEPLASRPEMYYPEPLYSVYDTALFPTVDAYAMEGSSNERLPDVPFDTEENRPISALNLATGTQENYRTVFLQRLANPLRAWNPPPAHPHYVRNRPVNPYITVDWLPVDLTVFNGEDAGPPPEWEGDWNWNRESIKPIQFSTRERGNSDRLQPNPFTWSIADLRRSNVTVDPANSFREPLAHTLGMLNTTNGPPRTNSRQVHAFENLLTGAKRQIAPSHYRGDPQRPFPWLTWNDRPFANALELLLVPSSSPSRLTIEYTTDTHQNPYFGGIANLRAPYAHLPNFFHSSQTGASSPNFCRLLELVEVPSPFVGTRRWYNPHFMVPNESEPGSDPARTFRPPFNQLSRFREPGRVNLNTIFDERVWQAIAYGFPAKSDTMFWREFVRSRRGYDPTEAKQYPSEFANPFRSALGAELQFELMGNRLATRPDVEATILRSRPGNRTQPLFADESSLPYNNTDQNPFFRYQFLRRLPNVVSTHSNVYAVWITVGYFQVDPLNGKLGRELNADTGEIRRHRSFYIIDRSIPVAFQPGYNHNVGRTVLVRRFIE